LRGHIQDPLHVRFSPDGQRIASGGEHREVLVWDAATGKLLHTLRGHMREAHEMAFSRDGRRLATTGSDSTVKIWDTATGDELLTLRGHTGRVQRVVFSPDDQWLASSDTDGTVRLWEATPPTAEVRRRREAAAVVNRLGEEVALKEEMLPRVRADPSLTEELRQEALTLVEGHQEDPRALNQASYRIVRQPGADVAKYRLALRQAQAARLAPRGYNFLPNYPPATHIGLAQYRLGRYREAIDCLTAAEAEDMYQRPDFRDGVWWHLAFQAMAYHQLDDKDKARTLLGRVRQILKDPVWGRNADLQPFLREVEELIEGKPAAPKP
jgi:tetratricopeptide (TPR) repeat protein